MKKTIMSVNTDPTIWDKGKFGPLAFIEVTFADGDMGSVACKPENADRVIGILEGLERKEFEFELEAKDDYNGIAQFKIKDYPGKPGAQQDGGSSGSPAKSYAAGGGRKSSPEDRSSIEAQVAAKIAGEIAVALVGKGELPIGKAIDYVTSATYLIDRAIRSAAQDSGSGLDRPSGGPLLPPGPDEAEGGVPASPSGWGETNPATAKQKAKANLMYGSAGKLMVAAKAMFPEIAKVGDITEDQMAALIEDKESA